MNPLLETTPGERSAQAEVIELRELRVRCAYLSEACERKDQALRRSEQEALHYWQMHLELLHDSGGQWIELRQARQDLAALVDYAKQALPNALVPHTCPAREPCCVCRVRRIVERRATTA
ncbi:MAG TPA: hypothetical protein VK395_28360 [Gemmataceae bacterium]|nr:hypothetical protein [Gemmataceae bacterium]